MSSLPRFWEGSTQPGLLIGSHNNESHVTTRAHTSGRDTEQELRAFLLTSAHTAQMTQEGLPQLPVVVH